MLWGALLVLAGVVILVIEWRLSRVEGRPPRVIERWFKPRARRK